MAITLNDDGSAVIPVLDYVRYQNPAHRPELARRLLEHNVTIVLRVRNLDPWGIKEYAQLVQRTGRNAQRKSDKYWFFTDENVALMFKLTWLVDGA
jgi:hypothetical protein